MSEAGSMKVALSRVGCRHLIRVLSFNEMFSAGPLCKLHNDEGFHARELWFQERFPDQGYHLNPQHKLEAMIQTLKEIPEDKKITIGAETTPMIRQVYDLHFLFLVRGSNLFML
ncbi:DUF1835 domain-containing protein [Paenibacillus sp. G2S3]|uniref:DUF1835 domain-containing protein n=1 Tax=Paenibacillus sp. G2S3 TaxID=3047872 RepID=UPI0024C1826C|nr:DUF1835 domain-containing protein [Paenibacillus sp. G2S3]WHY21852.1 DUF1835 domain-containing protein [Paenibacillus sp. G2S3]